MCTVRPACSVWYYHHMVHKIIMSHAMRKHHSNIIYHATKLLLHIIVNKFDCSVRLLSLLIFIGVTEYDDFILVCRVAFIMTMTDAQMINDGSVALIGLHSTDTCTIPVIMSMRVAAYVY